MSRVNDEEHRRTVEAMVPIWAELLNTEKEAITDTSNFFESGGHSLLGMLLVTRLERELGKSVPLFALVENPTVSSLATYLVESDGMAPVKEPKAPDGSTTQTERLLRYNDPDRRATRRELFEKYYATAIGSAAHAEFCRQVYGRNSGQHGMADFSQIDRMLDLLKPAEDDVVLDLGCGYGLISQYIAEQTGAHVVGIDLSPSAIAYANTLTDTNSKLRFSVMDIQELDFPPGTFSHIVSFDTIYYAPSLESLLGKFAEIGTDNLQVGIVRTFPIRSFTRETWSPDLTELAKLLKDTFGYYEAVDLSKEENEHWRKKVQVLESLRAEFLAEGNAELFEFRYTEAKYEAGIEQLRYIFVSGRR